MTISPDSHSGNAAQLHSREATSLPAKKTKLLPLNNRNSAEDKGGGRIGGKALIVVPILVFVSWANLFRNQNILTEYAPESEQLREENNLDNSTRYEKIVETTKEVGQYKYPKLGTDFVDDYIDHCADESCMKAFGNTSTMAGLKQGFFYSGFRNQMMAFTAMVLDCKKESHGQILLDTLKQKDTYGSNKKIPFERLWDVGYWNSFYPLLPRLVRPDPVIHDQWDAEHNRFYWYNGSFTDANNSTWSKESTRPYKDEKQHHLFAAYIGYTKGKGRLGTGLDGHRHPAEILMLRGAMRPHPKLRKIIDGFLASLQNGTDATEPVEYMTLHARIEPDMQKHPVCRQFKVLNLTDIFDWIEEKWPDPPAKHIFMPINRQMLEKEGSEDVVNYFQKRNQTEKINWIAVNNLRALNEARDKGLWNGRAKVFEFGANALKDTEFAGIPSTTGALVNFFIAIHGNIFIGTKISTYAQDIVTTRFFRNNMENYIYLPDGLHDWTPPGTIDPPQFSC